MDDQRARGARVLVAGLAVLAATACGSGAPDPRASPARPDPAVAEYCDTVLRVQAEQTAPGAAQGGVTASSAQTRRQIADLVRTAPPEITEQWRTVQQLTERSLALLARTGGDASRIDRAGLERLQADARPAAERIAGVTEQRCGITFRAPGGAN